MGSSSNNSPFTVPKGFRFHPSDEELIDYLTKKNQGEDSESINIIPEISLCNHEPRDLPALVFGRAEFLDKEWFTVGDTLDMEWYFFSPRDYKYPNSNRSNRTTEEGYWKITGKERKIKARGSNTVIGGRKILTFYERAEPKAKKTNWVIHEHSRAHSNDQIGDFVLCRLKKTSDKSDRDKEVSPICDEAETGSGGSSTVENQAAATGVITEAEENLAYKELVNIPNKDECNGSPTDSCLAEKNDPSYSVEGQPYSCISLEMIDELYDESGTLHSIFNPPQPHQQPQLPQPSQTYQPQVHSPSTVQSQLVNILHTNNVNYGKFHKRKYTFEDNTSDPPKKKSITNNDHDEVLGYAESCYENQAANDRIPEGYPQPGTNLGSLPIQQQQDSDYALPSINRELRDVFHDNDFIELDDLDDLLPPFGDIESSLAKFLYPIIGDSVVRSDGNTEVSHGSGYSALAIGAKLQCS